MEWGFRIRSLFGLQNKRMIFGSDNNNILSGKKGKARQAKAKERGGQLWFRWIACILIRKKQIVILTLCPSSEQRSPLPRTAIGFVSYLL